jgi:hypothetical protein
VSLTTDFVDFNEETKRYSVGVTAIVRVTLRDGVHHEDVGYGLLENSRSKGTALDKVCVDILSGELLAEVASSARKKQSRMPLRGHFVILAIYWEIVYTTSRIRKR